MQQHLLRINLIVIFIQPLRRNKCIKLQPTHAHNKHCITRGYFQRAFDESMQQYRFCTNRRAAIARRAADVTRQLRRDVGCSMVSSCGPREGDRTRESDESHNVSDDEKSRIYGKFATLGSALFSLILLAEESIIRNRVCWKKKTICCYGENSC